MAPILQKQNWGHKIEIIIIIIITFKMFFFLLNIILVLNNFLFFFNVSNLLFNKLYWPHFNSVLISCVVLRSFKSTKGQK